VSNSYEQIPVRPALDELSVRELSGWTPAWRRRPGAIIHYRVSWSRLDPTSFSGGKAATLLSGNFRQVSRTLGELSTTSMPNARSIRYESRSHNCPRIDMRRASSGDEHRAPVYGDYLKLPPLVFAFRNLAQEIAAPAPSNYDKAVRWSSIC